MHTYRCYAPGHSCPAELVAANTSFEAREQYARKHQIPVSDCISQRQFFFFR